MDQQEPNTPPAWHVEPIAEVCRRLGTDPDAGIDDETAGQRLRADGPNELAASRTKTAWHMLWEQLTATLVLLLLAAGLVSLALGEVVDAVAIAAIVLLNTLLGVTQDYRAQKAIQLLAKLDVPQVQIRRAGDTRVVSARDLVRGDVVMLAAGSRVPADARVIESVNLRIDEAPLTGESQPIDKGEEPLANPAAVISDRHNMVYMGTTVTYGRGSAVVTETGMRTELGHVSHLIETIESVPTPLQRRLAEIGRRLAIAALLLVGVVFMIGLAQSHPLRLVFLTAVSLAVAAVPEGLPAVVTITLALGARRMLQREALIRKLPAVEALGSVTVVCADKTGTLTENRMRVAGIQMAPDILRSSPAPGEGGTSPDTGSVETQDPGQIALLMAAALCNNAQLGGEKAEESWLSLGDPTETALLEAAAGSGLDKPGLDATYPRIYEIPFDAGRKRMTTVHRCPAEPSSSATAAPWSEQPYVAFTKGAPEAVIAVCERIWVDGKSHPLTTSQREQLLAANDRLAQGGVRVLSVAFKPLEQTPATESSADLEQGLTFAGLVGLSDPIRPEAKTAVESCRQAGIRPVMITGDHPLTAKQIARELGFDSEGAILTGQELGDLSPAQLEDAVNEVSVYARVLPEQKLDIVRAFQRQGEVTAMTGDGINDAPALRQADIGIAMGRVGTDVARETADVVLRDDNFATIVAAIEEGRVINDNIRKFLKYILSSNVGEILVMVVGPLIGMPLPLLPAQILWINLVTDGLPALALSVEPAEANTLHRPPYPASQSVFALGTGRYIVRIGLLIGTVSLLAGYWQWSLGRPEWQTMVFTTLTLGELAQALAVRSTRPILSISLFSNRWLLASVAVAVGLHLLVVYAVPLQPFLQTIPLSREDLLVSIALSVVVVVAVELEKASAARRLGVPDGQTRAAVGPPSKP